MTPRKRSFYEMLGVPRKAYQSEIDAAYALAMKRLNAEGVRGVAEAVNEARLIRDGYEILSNPAERASYDAKLAASDAGRKLVLYPKDSAARRKLGIRSVIFAVLAAVWGVVIYTNLTQDTDEVPFERTQAVAKQKGGQNPPLTTNAARPDTEDAKAGEEEGKR